MEKIIRTNNGIEVTRHLEVGFKTRVFFTWGGTDHDQLYDNHKERELTDGSTEQSHAMIHRMLDTADYVIEDKHNKLIMYHGCIKTIAYPIKETKGIVVKTDSGR